MIDYIVVIQAIVAGLILYRASHETLAWDRAGFALLACTAGLMTIRRVTASLDRYADFDRVLLPHIITWVMLASATCFSLELLKRAMVARQTGAPIVPRTVWGNTRFLWPFALMLLARATEYVPAPTPWDGEHVRTLSAEDAVREALDGTNTAVACEAVRRHSAKGIDTLRVIAGSGGPDAEAARIKLQALATRINEANDAQKPVPLITLPAPELKPAAKPQPVLLEAIK